jgi:hypothetical protein
MTDLKTVELQDQRAANLESLVLSSSVATVSPQDALVPGAALLDISYGDHRTRSYCGKAHHAKVSAAKALRS